MFNQTELSLLNYLIHRILTAKSEVKPNLYCAEMSFLLTDVDVKLLNDIRQKVLKEKNKNDNLEFINE